MFKRKKNREHGFSLIEVLAASVIFTFLSLAVIAYMGTSAKTNKDDENLTRAQNYAEIIMDYARKQVKNGGTYSIHLVDSNGADIINIPALQIGNKAAPGSGDWQPVKPGSPFSYYVTTNSTDLGGPIDNNYEIELKVQIQYPGVGSNSNQPFTLVTKIRTNG
jgi:prepilin-type N-terminal cleavage/methylation domain-containing protein